MDALAPLNAVIDEIRRRYPGIPESKANWIAVTTPVCSDEKLAPDIRARRAVRAYIRHELTDYDDIADRKGKWYARDVCEADAWGIELELRGAKHGGRP